MKKKTRKIIGIVVDLLLITAVFAVTDVVLREVFHSENMWLDLGVYIVFYGVAFGSKRGIVLLWNRFFS